MANLRFPPAIGAYFNKKAYTDPALRKEYTNKGFWVNIRLIRYADVLLMGAEAANEKGIPGEAIDYLEQVRARARGTNTNILPKVTTTDRENCVMPSATNAAWNWEWNSTVSTILFAGVLQRKCCTQPVKQIIRTKTHYCHCLKQRLTSLKEYWYRTPTINKKSFSVPNGCFLGAETIVSRCRTMSSSVPDIQHIGRTLYEWI